MKKILSILLTTILFVGCAADWMITRQNNLERRLELIEGGGKNVGPIISKKELQEIAESGEAVKIRGFTCTVGGVSGCLDNYPEDLLVEGDLAMVFNTTTGVMSFHVFDSDDSNDASDPEYVYPVDRDGNQVWKLFNGFRYLPASPASMNFRDSTNSNIQEVVAKISTLATLNSL